MTLKQTILIALVLGVMGKAQAQKLSKIDTSNYSKYIMDHSPIKLDIMLTYSYNGFNYRAGNKVIIRISAPDSTNTVTVHLSKNDITFTNDSTFTFKRKAFNQFKHFKNR